MDTTFDLLMAVLDAIDDAAPEREASMQADELVAAATGR